VRTPHIGAKVGSEPIDSSVRAFGVPSPRTEKEYPMLRKFAVALLAASVFTAPVLAQGTQTANPPAKTGAVAAAPKAIAAKPPLKVAKVKHAKRHVAHVKRVKHVRAASSLHGTRQARHVVHSKSTTDARGGAMNSAKPRSVTN
jgi:hypothetical protein